MREYRPTGTNKEFLDLMAQARYVNRERDRTDKACGMLVPRESGPAVYLSTAISAVECGLMVREWDSVAEGLAMLQDLKGIYGAMLEPKKAMRGAHRQTSV